jgi:hypothetical protein
MIPRPPQCDDDRCDYDENGQWQHHAACWALEEAERDKWIEDAAFATAREDGYTWQPTPVLTLPAQRDRRWTA